jgi:hypothetical protein
MAVKYVKDFSFDKSFGYTGSSGPTEFERKQLIKVVAPAKNAPAKATTPNANKKAVTGAAQTPQEKQARTYDDSMPTSEEMQKMREAREYMREDKATSEAAKREMGFKEGGIADLKQDKKMIAESVHKHEKAQHPGKPLTKLKKGGSVMEKATGERYASKSAMMKHEKTETPRMQREEMVQKRVVRGPAMAAGRDPRIPMLMCGGKVKK